MASSANIILAGAVAAGTETIRVGTGSLNLSNYVPLVVAEQIGTLDALHPGRFDLGLGRAPGTDPWTAAAIRLGRPADQDFAAQLEDLRLQPRRPPARRRRVRQHRARPRTP